MASKVPRGARYWLKDNSMDYFYPKVTKEEWDSRRKRWQAGEAALFFACVPTGVYGILNYLWPQHFDLTIPYETFVGYDYIPRALHRAVHVPRKSDE